MSSENQTDNNGASRNGGGASVSRIVRLWDMPTRLFHWIQAILFVALWVTGNDGPLDWHMRIGEAMLALLLFRIVWGFVGSRHSRFVDFVAGWRRVRVHLGEAIRVARFGPAGAAHDEPHVGHTSLGGWMIVVLLFLMTAQCVTGLFATDDFMTDGPLNHLVSGRAARVMTVIHMTAFNVLLALIALHIAAAFFYLLRKRENLIVPLITGRRRLPEALASREGRLVSVWRALLILVLAAAIVRAAIAL